MAPPIEQLRRFELDERGEAYVREHLTDVNILCSALLDVFTSTKGAIWTLAPVKTPLERLCQMTRGDLLAANRDASRAVRVPGRGVLMAVESLHLQRAERVLETLQGAHGRVCLVDDFNPTWGGQHYVPEPSAFGVGQEVYHLVTGEETPDTVADILALGDTIWHGVSAVCQPEEHVSQSTLSSPDALKACARTVIEISCTAYDREGFIVWTKDQGDGRRI